MTPLFDAGNPRPLHFLGIGGAGMSALALAALRRGVAVSGCDAATAGFDDLARAGATLFHGHSPDHVAGARAVIVTAAVPTDHPELLAAHQHGVPVVPRKVALAELVNGHTLVALAGTHGKTTTTVMTTIALEAVGLAPSGLAGGRVEAWGGNALLGGDALWVVEADEYDQAFLTLQPTVAVINNVEADHLECYGSLEAMEDAFVTFASRARRTLVGTADAGSDRVAARLGDAVQRFGTTESSDIRIVPHHDPKGGNVAAITWPDGFTVALRLMVPGLHNLRNATAALAVVRELGADVEHAAQRLASFSGVGRRFERLGRANGIEFIDDYAHHPTELAATLTAARQAFPGRRILAVFQPHLFSRTRDHAASMGQAIALADRAIVADVYPAREAPIAGITGALVVDAARAAGMQAVEFVAARSDLDQVVRDRIAPDDVVITLGAGDITTVGRLALDHLRTGT